MHSHPLSKKFREQMALAVTDFKALNAVLM
jgi:hypothetical protein